MKTPSLFLLSALVGLASAPVAFGQTAPATPSLGLSENASVTSAAAQKPNRPRAHSNDVAASISASLPKYNPPPKAPEPRPEEELPDLRETDKPRNGIIRLPQHVVREKKPPVLRERDVYTSSGLGALAVSRYITDTDHALNPFTLAWFGKSAEDRALAMYAEDERLQNITDLNEAAGLVSASDKAAGLYIKRETQKAYLRRNDFGRSSDDPK